MIPAPRRFANLALVAAAMLLWPVGSAADNSEIVEAYQDILVQDRDEEDLFDKLKELRPRIDFFTRGMFDGDFGSGDVDWWRTGGRVSLPIPISEKLILNPSISGGAAFYDFGGDPSFLDAGQGPGSDPFDDLYDVRFRLEGRYLIDDDWGVLGGTWISSQYEDGADFGDAMRVGAMVAVTHQLFEGVTIVGGVGVSEKFDGGVSIGPFLQGSWKVNDWLKIETEGLGLRAEAKLNESVRAFVFGGVNSRRYLLDDRNDGPDGVGDGWIRDRRVPVGAGFEWRITKGFRLHVDGGAMLSQKLKVIDDDDDEFDTVTLDSAAPFASIRLEARF